ncbi:MAG: serine hydrolase domain-containing protein [Nocardioidaceae bacterium]
MQSLQEAVDGAAERTRFSGVVSLDHALDTEFCRAYGVADRSQGILNTVQTLFATASGSKGLTALAVMSLVERGTLALDMTARSLLGEDLPLIANDVTIEQLLAHRSGIGDYLDENAVGDLSDYVMPVSVHELATTEQFLPLLNGHETVFLAGRRFAYNNGGYVVLALLAERASGVDFHQLVHTLVCEPAGMVDTAFLRSDELPGRAARGYLSVDSLRTNRVPSPRTRQRRWRDLLNCCRPQRVLGLALRWTDRLAGAGCRDGAAAQRLAGWSEGAWPIIKLLNDRLGI